MKQKKSIKEVILWGQVVVNIPAIAIAFSLVILAFNFEDLFLTEPFDLHIIWRMLIVFVAFIIGIILSWLYWSIAVPKWRVWAYKNVKKKEWEDLMWAAVDAKLIWTPGHPLEATEIRGEEATEETAVFYEHISAKMRREQALGSYSDDVSVPLETHFFPNKTVSTIAIIVIFILAAIVLFTFISKANIVVNICSLGLLSFAVFSYFSSPLSDSFKKDKTQLILNEKGMSIKKKELEFYPWERVDYIKWDDEQRVIVIVVENENQSKEEFSNIIVNFSLLNLTHREFLKYAQVYMGRYDRNNLAPLN